MASRDAHAGSRRPDVARPSDVASDVVGEQQRGQRVGTDRLDVSIVIPTTGRASLGMTLRSLVEADPDERVAVHQIVLVDDRGIAEAVEPANPAPTTAELRSVAQAWLGDVDTDIAIARRRGRGPAGARNLGITCTATPWVVVLDDDVVVSEHWWRSLADDLAEAADDVAAIFAKIDVPLPEYRRATDWERHTARLSTARWITADAAIRRSAFEEAGGFDEGFDRAYCEDSDLALRLLDLGWRLGEGGRRSTHPPRPAPLPASVHAERGEVTAMALSSVAIPPASCVHRARGWWRTRRRVRWARARARSGDGVSGRRTAPRVPGVSPVRVRGTGAP